MKSGYTEKEGKLKYDLTNPDTLTVSALEYAIISTPSIAEYDEDSEVVAGTMELDQQLVEQGFERDRERYDVDSDQFKDGTVLLEKVAFKMQRRNEMLQGEQIWTLNSFRGHLAEVLREMRKEKRDLVTALKVTRKAFSQAKADLSRAITKEQGKELFKEMKTIERKGYRIASKLDEIGNIRWMLADMRSQTNLYSAPTFSPYEEMVHRRESFLHMSHPNYVKEMPKVIPGAHIMPDNQIQVHEPIITEVDSITPAQTLFRPTLEMLRNGVLGVCRLSDGTYAPRYAKSARIAPTTPKNANPRLKATLSRLMMAG